MFNFSCSVLTPFGSRFCRQNELAKKSKKTVISVPKENKFITEQYTQLRNKLEQKTGYHFDVKSKKNGGGEITIKFGNEAEFNDIFTYLMK